MKKAFVLLCCLLLLTGCESDKEVIETSLKSESTESQNESAEIQSTDTKKEDEKEYSLEDGKYQISDTFNVIYEYDNFLFQIVTYSDSKEEQKIDDMDFIIRQMNIYKERSEKSLNELDNYTEFSDIMECKESLIQYQRKVTEYVDLVLSDMPSENDDKYKLNDYLDKVYSYCEIARKNVDYIWNN